VKSNVELINALCWSLCPTIGRTVA